MYKTEKRIVQTDREYSNIRIRAQHRARLLEYRDNFNRLRPEQQYFH